MNSHELHSETMSWTVPKTLLAKRIFNLYEIMNIEDENHIFLECLTYTHIKSEFQNICFNTYLSNLLAPQNYGKLGMLVFKLFKHRNKILKQIK